MKIKIKVPSPGESITQVQLAEWLADEGEQVEKDQEIAEIDSDKATLSISAEEGGKLHRLVEEGDTIDVGAVVAEIDTEAKGEVKEKEQEKEQEKVSESDASRALSQSKGEVEQHSGSDPERGPEPVEGRSEGAKKEKEKPSDNDLPHFSPLAKKLMKENGMTAGDFVEWLKKQRVSREDIEAASDSKSTATTTSPSMMTSWGGGRETSRKKLTTLRLKLAERLVAVKNETAMLTTFNEVDMSGIMTMRKKYKEKFIETHGVNVGFMSFFTKAVTIVLHDFPQVNSMIEEDELVMHDYADIGIAVSTKKGLMVPVIRNAEQLSLAGIEEAIKEMAEKARKNRISLDDMKGGTFTITNGGVFGSMLSTPILNPPQSAILGMHNIIERPVAVNGKVEVRPVMFVALSYDHRVIDGKESVSFLVRVKELLEDPTKMLLGGKNPEEALLEL